LTNLDIKKITPIELNHREEGGQQQKRKDTSWVLPSGVIFFGLKR
jgi:hypothetical protein